MASLTEPPLESSTTVAPRSCRSRANSSNSFGLSAVTMPTALIQPRQSGWQATQLNFIGSLRSSRVPLTRAELPDVAIGPVRVMHTAAAQKSTEPPNLIDSVKLDPSPCTPKGSGNGLKSHRMILSFWCYEKGNLTSDHPSSRIRCTALQKRSISACCDAIAYPRRFHAKELGKQQLPDEQIAQ